MSTASMVALMLTATSTVSSTAAQSWLCDETMSLPLGIRVAACDCARTPVARAKSTSARKPVRNLDIRAPMLAVEGLYVAPARRLCTQRYARDRAAQRFERCEVVDEQLCAQG